MLDGSFKDWRDHADGRMLSFLQLEPGMRLLSIRSSDISFAMGAKGPLLEKAAHFQVEMPLF